MNQETKGWEDRQKIGLILLVLGLISYLTLTLTQHDDELGRLSHLVRWWLVLSTILKIAQIFRFRLFALSLLSNFWVIMMWVQLIQTNFHAQRASQFSINPGELVVSCAVAVLIALWPLADLYDMLKSSPRIPGVQTD